MFKTLEMRVADMLQKYPLGDIEWIYLRAKENHMKSIWKMQHRISDRIQHMIDLNHDIYFLTFTFDSEHLPSKQNEIKTEQLIREYMQKNNAVMYVANIDYGKNNNRFHWHAVALAYNPFDNKSWTQGAINFKKVRKSSISLQLSRYLIKLKRHATKIDDPFSIYYPFKYKNIK